MPDLFQSILILFGALCLAAVIIIAVIWSSTNDIPADQRKPDEFRR